jgi:hypothetical protein
MKTFVVVLRGHNRGRVGTIPGQLHVNAVGQGKRWVTFPHLPYPKDMRLVKLDNLREATELEILISDVNGNRGSK